MPTAKKKTTKKKVSKTQQTTGKKEATIMKHKMIMKNIGENGGSFRKALKKVGYSQKYADNPQRLVRTKTWQELMDIYIPEDKMLKVLDEQFKAYKVIPEGKFTEREEVPDNDARLKAVDISMKARSKYTLKIETKVDKFDGWTPDQLEEYAETGEIPEIFRYRFEGTSES